MGAARKSSPLLSAAAGAAYKRIEDTLDGALGMTWRSTYDEDASKALDTPYVLRRLLMAAGEPVESRDAVEAEPVTIDDSTPEGVLALLDAAATAAERLGLHAAFQDIGTARHDLADSLDIPPPNPCRPIPKRVDGRISDIERRAATFAQHDSALLLGQLMADAADLPGVMRAAIGGRGMGEAETVERIAAAATALVGKLRANLKGGAW